jgi:hypothetical protein
MKVAPRKFNSDVKIDPETIQRLIGTYQLPPSVLVEVTAKESRLMVQLTGQQALRVFPESDTVWNYRDVKAQLVFELPEKGPASKVTLHQNGRVLPAPRK